MKNELKVIVGATTQGTELMQIIIQNLKNKGYDIRDIGSPLDLMESDSAEEDVCKAVQSGEYDRGILISEFGQDMNIFANKYTGLRSLVCSDPIIAKMGRADINTNILCLGEMNCMKEQNLKTTEEWLSTGYADKNVESLKQIAEYEKTRKRK